MTVKSPPELTLNQLSGPGVLVKVVTASSPVPVVDSMTGPVIWLMVMCEVAPVVLIVPPVWLKLSVKLRLPALLRLPPVWVKPANTAPSLPRFKSPAVMLSVPAPCMPTKLTGWLVTTPAG